MMKSIHKPNFSSIRNYALSIVALLLIGKSVGQSYTDPLYVSSAVNTQYNLGTSFSVPSTGATFSWNKRSSGGAGYNGYSKEYFMTYYSVYSTNCPGEDELSFEYTYTDAVRAGTLYAYYISSAPSGTSGSITLGQKWFEINLGYGTTKAKIPKPASGAKVMLFFKPASLYVGEKFVGFNLANLSGSGAKITCGGCEAPSSLILTANPSSICKGSNVTLNASPTGGSCASGWQYNFGSGYSTSTSATVTPASTGSQSVTIRCGSSGSECSKTASTNVTVNDPQVKINGSIAYTQTMCDPASTVLTATGADSYTWSPADDISATTGATVTATPTASTIYTVTGTTSGCTGTATANLTVNYEPYITIQPFDHEWCQGEAAQQLEATVIDGTSYQWEYSADGVAWGNAEEAGSKSGNDYTITPSKSGFYRLVVTNDCGSITSDEAEIIIHEAPTVTINGVKEYTEPYCGEGTGEVELIAAGADTYTWSPTEGLISASGAINYAGPSVPTIYTVVGKKDGCTDTATANVYISADPVITKQPENITACTGETDVFMSVTAEGPNLTYTWEQSLDNGTSWSTLADHTNPVKIAYTVTEAMNGAIFKVTVTNDCISVHSTTAKLTVLPAHTIMATGSTTQTVSVTEHEAISPITITFGGGATDAAYDKNLGLTIAKDGNTFTISGIPTEEGVITFTTSGNECTPQTQTITINDQVVNCKAATEIKLNVGAWALCAGEKTSISVTSLVGFECDEGEAEYSFNNGAWGSTKSWEILTGGTYNIAVRCSNPISPKCTSDTNVTINSAGAQPDDIIITPVCYELPNAGYTLFAQSKLANGKIKWYSDAAMTHQIETGTSFITGSILGDTTFYVTTYNTTTCENATPYAYTIKACAAPLGIAKTVDNATVCETDTLTFTITLTNLNDVEVANISLSDVLPNSVKYVSGSGVIDGVTVYGRMNYSTNTVYFFVPKLPATQHTADFTIKAMALKGKAGNHQNKASVQTKDYRTPQNADVEFTIVKGE